MNKTKWKYHSVAIGVVVGVIAFVFYGLPYIQPYIQSKRPQPTIPSKSPPTTLSGKTTKEPKYYDFTSLQGSTTSPWFTKIPQIQKPNLIKIIQSKQPKISQTIAKEIAVAVVKYSKKCAFPPELIICLIERESSFNPKAVSKYGCKGLMQIHEKFHVEKLKKLNIKGAEIFRIDSNIHIGCIILKEYYNSTKSISGALKKYLGANHKGYICDILSNFTDLIITEQQHIEK